MADATGFDYDSDSRNYPKPPSLHECSDDFWKDEDGNWMLTAGCCDSVQVTFCPFCGVLLDEGE